MGSLNFFINYSFLTYILLAYLATERCACSQELERKILQGSIDYRGWTHSNDAKSFIQNCAMVNAGTRLTAQSALNHPWLVKAGRSHTLEKEHSARLGSVRIPNELVTSLELYKMAKPLKKIGLNVLARKATSSNYRELFRTIDTSQSGTLTKAEFMKGFANTGNSEEELKDLFEALDVNQNDEILYSEFLAATLEAQGELEEAALEEAFDLIIAASKSKRFEFPIVQTKKDRAEQYITAKHVKALLGDSYDEASIEAILEGFEKVDYETFAGMFEHGFDARPNIDTIVETSLNEEQLSRLREDEMAEHLKTIRESDD